MRLNRHYIGFSLGRLSAYLWWRPSVWAVSARRDCGRFWIELGPLELGW